MTGFDYFGILVQIIRYEPNFYSIGNRFAGRNVHGPKRGHWHNGTHGSLAGKPPKRQPVGLAIAGFHRTGFGQHGV